MSDDRFKKARRDLIDEDDDDGEESEDAPPDEDLSSAKTAMVDLDSLQEGAAEEADSGPEGSSPSDPSRSRDEQRSRRDSGGRDRRGSSPHSRAEEDDSPFGDTEDSDELGRRGSDASARRDDRRFGSRGDDSPEANRRRQTSEGTPVESGGPSDSPSGVGSRDSEVPGGGGHHTDTSQSDYREEGTLDAPGGTDDASAPPTEPEGQQQVFVPGDDGGADSDEKTAFVNLDDFADEPSDGAGGPNPGASPGAGGQAGGGQGQTFSPGDDTSGYEGSTQFVNLEELSEGAQQDNASENIFNDSILQQGYNFGREDIEKGEATLVYASNPLGEPVLLRQVWSGDASAMPSDMRQRVQELSDVQAPGLLALNGMVITDTGCWVEFDRPPGERLDQFLESEGGQPPERVNHWVEQIGETLQAIHEQGFVYANLTPDAVWVAEGQTFLEPFDILALRDRGDLGEFGPPELRSHGEHQSLSPQTDVYTLGVLTAACLSGLPLDSDSIAQIDDESTIRAIREAVSDAPDERYPEVDAYVEDLLSEELTLNDVQEFLEELEFIHLLIGVVALGAASFGAFALYERQTSGGQSGASGAGPKGGAAARKGQTAPDKASADKKKGGETPASAKGDTPPKVQAEPDGDYESDPRLSIHTSYRFNPPEEAKEKLTDEEKKRRTEELKNQFKDKRNAADKSESTEDYRAAAETLVKMIRLGGDGADWARKKLDKLDKKEPMREYRKEKVDLVHENFLDESYTDAEIALQDLYAVTADRPAREFMNRISTPGFVVQTDDSDDSDE